MNLYHFILHQQTASSPVRQPHAYTGIFHRTGDSCIRRLFINLFDSLQCLCNSCRGICDLSVWKHLSGPHRIPISDLPWRDSHHLRQQIQIPFCSKTGLCHAESAKCSSRRIVGIHGFSVNVNGLEIVRPCRMGTGSLQNRSAQRCIRTCIRYNYSFHCSQISVLVTCCGNIHPHRMPFGMHSDTFLSGQLYFHRTLCQVCHQCGMMLYTDILFSTESAAYQLVFHNHFFRRKSKHHTAFMLGIVGSLIRRIDKYSVIKRHGHCTLRLQKGMFRPRSFIMSGHFIFRVGDHFFCISSDQMLMGEYISIRLDSRMNAGCVLF